MFSKKKSRYRNKGFTLIESVVILVVIGIVTLMAAPSFGDLFDSIRVKEATTEIRIALSNSQRYAMRNRSTCAVELTTNQFSTETNQTVPSTIHTDCDSEKETTFSDKVIVATNMLPIPQDFFTKPESTTIDLSILDKEVSKWCEKHKDHNHEEWISICTPSLNKKTEDPKLAQVAYGNLGNVLFEIHKDTNTSPLDSSGKVVLYSRGKQDLQQKCIVISRRLGLTRFGAYKGGLTQNEITDGSCTAEDWTKQT